MNTLTMSLKEQWESYQIANPKVRIRDAAKALSTSEAQLLATNCGANVTQLDVDFRAFLSTEIPTLGEVKAITRNDDVVHERVGTYLNPHFNEASHIGMFVGADIDLRIFLQHWKLTFSVTEMIKDKPRYSIQFFDQGGNAIHKIFLTSKSDFESFLRIEKQYKHSEQSTELSVEPVTEKLETRNDSPEIATFQEGWKNLKDTHSFHPLMMKHKLTRLQALEIAPKGFENNPNRNFAQRVDLSSVRNAFASAAHNEVPIMVFVGNKGLIQIHTGPVNKLLEHSEWYNVMDPEFNLHLRESAVDQVWVVRKPTEDGIVSSLEIFDKNEKLICTLFGKRKPGIPEDPNWTAIVDSIQNKLHVDYSEVV